MIVLVFLLLHVTTTRSASAEDPKERVYQTPTSNPKHEPKPKVQGWATSRVEERLNRGLVAKLTEEEQVYLSWRLLATDADTVAFNVYRQANAGSPKQLNPQPLTQTTDFVDQKPLLDQIATYWVVPIVGGNSLETSEPVLVDPAAENSLPYQTINFQGDYMPSKIAIADLNGDGTYDFVIKQPHYGVDPGGRSNLDGTTYKLEAYLNDGTFLWRKDLGQGIEPGVWYSPYVVYDFNGDGKAEVAVKISNGIRDEDGRVRTGDEWIAILDGLTGDELDRAPWPPRDPGYGDLNRNNRNQLGVAYLDGKTPCLLVARGTYKMMVVDAYQFHDGKLDLLWHWNGDEEEPVIRSQGAHSMLSADVDGDGCDEVILGSAVLDDDGTCLWSAGLGHPDKMYVSQIDPQREGMQIFYGIEPWHDDGKGICMVDAKTGELLWQIDKPTKHIGDAMVADIDPEHPGLECWASEDKKAGSSSRYMFTAQGKLIATDDDVPPCRPLVWWDGDLLREFVITKRDEQYQPLGTEVVKYKGPTLLKGIEGRVIFTGDILGDWREEIITVLPGELRIYTTTIPAKDRRVTLMQDPIYRSTVTHQSMGYPQSPLPGYYLGEK